MQIGDKIKKLVDIDPTQKNGTSRQEKYKTMVGEVVYSHPQRRFYVLEFTVRAGKFRQSFPFNDGEGTVVTK